MVFPGYSGFLHLLPLAVVTRDVKIVDGLSGY